jgi:hypothetical protein
MCIGCSSLIGLVLVGGARFAAHRRHIILILVVAEVANFTFRNGGHKFFSSRAKFAIVG